MSRKMTPLTRPTYQWIGVALLAGLVSGCAHFYDPVDEALLSLQSCMSAKMAWHRNRQEYLDVCYPHHFGKGFRAGYQSVCLGGAGCPPTLPPREYWSVCHQSEAGRTQSVEWFNGFSEGALVAQMDGRDRHHEIVTSQEINGQGCRLETEYHFNAEQSTPYSPEEAAPLGSPPIGPSYDDWRERSPAFGLPPVPEVAPHDYPPIVNPPKAIEEDETEWQFQNGDEQPTSAPVPLPPLDESKLPPPPKGPPIPNIDFHVDAEPDGRPKGLVPTGFLSPEQEAGEQLGSRINAIWRKFF
ncbi:MAG: hypothetical protein KDA52_06705 [Planctomycetaceae bacterium]|nr:hypothetical protein [Planctomycetaceae bacterium]